MNAKNRFIKQEALIIAFLLMSVFSVFGQSVEEKLALQYFQDKEYDKAADLYKDIYREKPSPVFYNYYLDCLFAKEDYKTAEKFVSSVAKKHPMEQKYKVEYAYVIDRSGNHKKAVKFYEKAIKSLKSNRADVIDLANAFKVRGLNDFALKTFERGKKMIKDPPLNMELADLYMSMGNYKGMVGEYLDMVDDDEQYMQPIQAKLQLLISDPSNDGPSEALREELLRRTQKYPSKTVYSELLYWYSLQKKQFKLALIQAKALDKRYHEDGERIFQLAKVLYSNSKYDLAIDAYEYVMDYGKNNRLYQTSSIEILQARFMRIIEDAVFEQSQLEALAIDYEALLHKYGQSGSTVGLMMNLAHLYAFYLDSTDRAITLLEKIPHLSNVDNYTRAKAKLDMGDILLFSGQKWSASLLYKQVEKANKYDAIGFEARLKAAKFFYYVGEMDYAKVQLEVLKGATSKLIANDALDLYLLIIENMSLDSSYDALNSYAKADLLAYQHNYIDADLTLDSILTAFPVGEPIRDNVWYKKAEIAVELKKYQLADSLFQKCVNEDAFGTLADNALINRARINDNQLNNPTKAKELYKKILMDYPGSLFTVEARKRYREMEAASEKFMRGAN
ncbi:MAG: tetratricopeptide repeat protein [Bacteroidales bacterium]|nr:tetratricopeptide repeat protein [Bacteroidales bacterium]